MRLAAAQIKPSVGSVEGNMERHFALIKLAVHHGANLVIFPELSLTGYEPALAAELSRCDDDTCFAQFQSLCDTNNVSVGVGFPLRTNALPRISTLTIRPHLPPHLYSKRYLHEDEQLFFDRGTNADSMIHDEPKLSLAICYELSVPEHAQSTFQMGATAYLASAAKTARGVEEASQRLSQIADEYSAIVMLSNSIGLAGGEDCAGHSSAWGRNGRLLDRLDSDSEGVIVVDYDTEKVVTDTLAPTDQ